jgi:hypothetical protein
MWRSGGEQVVGIHSLSDCVSQAVDTRVDEYQDDINTFLGNGPTGPQCFEDGQCATGCGVADPDCPCAQDGFCTEACADPTMDPDCQTTCEADGLCNPGCVDTPDPDCGSTEPPPNNGNDWVAGDLEAADYDGNVVSSCAYAPVPSSNQAMWLLLASGLLLRRRRD